MNLHAEMRAYAAAHPNRGPGELAAMFVKGCRIDDLLPLVADEFKAIGRSEVRAVEVEALRSSANRPRIRTADSVRASLADLQPLLDQVYRIGDGQPRLFRSMTREEHMTRIIMLRGQTLGIQRAITAHEDAVALLDKCGANSLDEVENGVAVAA